MTKITATNSTTEPRFNLVTEPWIPVMWRDGRRRPERVSLRDAVSQGTQILDLAGRPHERVVLLRLLICIAQSALKGPEKRSDWRKLGPPHDELFTELKAKLAAYLAPHDDTHPEGKFWLFHPKHPFLQTIGLSSPPQKTEKPKRRKKGAPSGEAPADGGKNLGILDLSFARDETSTLFDQFGGTERAFSDAQLAVMLVTYLNFTPGQLIGKILWNGKPTRDEKGRLPPQKGQMRACTAPCAVDCAIHAALLGSSLLHTIHLNLIPVGELGRLGHTTNDLGKPVWELETQRLCEETEQPGTAIGYLERLVPLSRLIWLNNAGRKGMLLANGINYSPFHLDEKGKRGDIKIRPPSAALVSNKQFLCAEPGKSLWRVLHALALLPRADRAGKAPGVISNAEEIVERTPEVELRLLAVALLTDQATLENVAESTFQFRAGLMANDTAFADYQDGLAYAEREGGSVSNPKSKLAKAVGIYFDKLGEKARIADLKNVAVRDFWNTVEQDAPVLLGLLDAELGEDGRYKTGQIDFTRQDNPWAQRVRSAATAAYRRACPCLNARQLIAHAEGLKAFERKPPKKGKST